MKPVYDSVTSIQQAINMAVAENRVVRFLSDKSNEVIRSEIDDLKGCHLRKPSRESNDIAILPPGVEDFDFSEVDMSLGLWLPRRYYE